MFSMIDNSLNISDSVITGDVTNILHSNRVTCEACKATGNLTIFECSRKGCNKTFCEHCKSSTDPKFCAKCIEEKSRKKTISSNIKIGIIVANIIAILGFFIVFNL